jgi:hypothetical protein
MDIIQKLKIEKLLELRDNLSDIAVELYGELYVCNDSFWNSPTEKELQKVEIELFELGWKHQPTLFEKIGAKIINKKRK